MLISYCLIGIVSSSGGGGTSLEFLSLFLKCKYNSARVRTPSVLARHSLHLRESIPLFSMMEMPVSTSLAMVMVSPSLVAKAMYNLS